MNSAIFGKSIIFPQYPFVINCGDVIGLSKSDSTHVETIERSVFLKKKDYNKIVKCVNKAYLDKQFTLTELIIRDMLLIIIDNCKKPKARDS